MFPFPTGSTKEYGTLQQIQSKMQPSIPLLDNTVVMTDAKRMMGAARIVKHEFNERAMEANTWHISNMGTLAFLVQRAMASFLAVIELVGLILRQNRVSEL